MRELTSAARSLKEGYESLLEKHKELECEKKSLLAEIAALNWKVQELERNLEYGAKVVVKTAEKLYYEKQQNKRYREALEEIANWDGWLIEPNPLCTVEEAYERCVDIAIEALEDEE